MLSARTGGEKERRLAPFSLSLSLRDCRAFLSPPLAGGGQEGARAFFEGILPVGAGRGSEAGPRGASVSCSSGDAAPREGEAATGPGRLPVPSSKEDEGCGGRRVLGRRSDGRAPGGAGSARCVRRLDGSLVPAIRITYRVSLRSSSSREPRYPSTGVVSGFRFSRPRSTRASIGIRAGEREEAEAFLPFPFALRLSVARSISREGEEGARSGVLGTAPPLS